MLALAFVVAVTGCGDSARAVHLIPLIHEDSIEFTAQDVMDLTAIKAQYPSLFDKLQKHNNANAARIHKQNLLGLAQREELWKIGGESDETIKILRASLEKQFNIRPDKEPDKPERP